MVLCIHWHPETNKIASGGLDHAVYIWTKNQQKKFIASLVIASQQRAVMSVNWSNDGKFFAMGTGSNFAFMGYFSTQQNWWQTKRLAKHKSTVTSVKFHPSDAFVATASTDQHILITPALGSETKAEHIAKLTHAAWIHCIDWSPDGRILAVTDHASNVKFYTFNANMEVEKKIDFRWKFLPFISIKFTEQDSLMCSGFDKLPLKLKKTADDTWQINKQYAHQDVVGGVPKKQESKSLVHGIKSVFEANLKQPKGHFTADISTKQVKQPQSPHTNYIISLTQVGKSSDLFTTCDTNGNLIFWKI